MINRRNPSTLSAHIAIFIHTFVIIQRRTRRNFFLRCCSLRHLQLTCGDEQQATAELKVYKFSSYISSCVPVYVVFEAINDAHVSRVFCESVKAQHVSKSLAVCGCWSARETTRMNEIIITRESIMVSEVKCTMLFVIVKYACVFPNQRPYHEKPKLILTTNP